MNPGLSIEMFPAHEGDCLLLTYTDGATARRVLIDGGRAPAYQDLRKRLADLPEPERTLELLVVTHVDRDHIEGILSLIDDPERPVQFRDAWFNGYHHLKGEESFGAVEGEKLTQFLLSGAVPWNAAFGGKAVCIEGDDLPRKELAGGLTLTLLSPDRAKLAKLVPAWETECAAAGLVPTVEAPEHVETREESFGGLDVDSLAEEPFVMDDTAPNGTSIALLAEYAGRRVLLGADAHPDRLIASLDRLGEGKPVAVDAFKLCHHGSPHNLSVDLLGRLSCPRYLVSTNGAYFKHPGRAAIARVLRYGGDHKVLVFNYRSAYTEIWDDPSLQETYGYEAKLPARQGFGCVELPACG